MKLTGYAAIAVAAANGLTLDKYNDPIEDARTGLTPDEARKIAAEDPNLIYIDAEFAGWTEGDGSGHDGYNVADYFECQNSVYRGADDHGIEPRFTA